nr:unnamed protein product [Callosobruchus analis]
MLYADQVPVPPFPGTVGLIDSRCASLTYPLKPPQYAHNLGTANLTFRQDCGSLLLLTSLVEMLYADQVPVPPFPGTVGLIDSRCASLTYPLKPPQYAHNLGTANLTFRQDCGSLLLLTSLVSFFP